MAVARPVPVVVVYDSTTDVPVVDRSEMVGMAALAVASGSRSPDMMAVERRTERPYFGQPVPGNNQTVDNFVVLAAVMEERHDCFVCGHGWRIDRLRHVDSGTRSSSYGCGVHDFGHGTVMVIGVRDDSLAGNRLD